MHETALIAQLLKRVEEEGRAAGARRVTVVRLQVGELSGVEPELLRSAFDLLAPGTIGEGARLELESVPLEACCETCGQRFRVERFQFGCPSCGRGPVQVVAGEDLVFESMSVC